MVDLLRRVLYRDASVLIIDKPYGLAVHKGPKGGETLADHWHKLRFGLPTDPEPAHRLDRETAGCLVLGRHRQALAALGRLFREGLAEKTYLAVTEGGPAAEQGEIDLALAPKDPGRGWWMKPDPAGEPALTRFRVLGRQAGQAGEAGRTLLALSPVTGRTHQLRVHCAASGFPILGDPIYGTAPRFGGPGLHLLARRIALPLDPRRDTITAEAPVPLHMRETVAGFGDIVV